MPDQILIGNFAKGLTTDRLPFVIDNDAFPTMYNTYSWRGRAKRKRGTVLLGRLQRQVQLAGSPNAWQYNQITLSGGAGNLLTAVSASSSASIVPGSITFSVGGNTYTEPATPNGTLVGAPSGSGTINYSTGAFTITGGGSSTVTGTFSYYPGLPVLGLEDFVSATSSSQYPLLLAFDDTYAYQVNQTNPANTTFYGINYYKATNNPVTWSGQDYQQFWTTNYQGAFWAVNNNPGFSFQNIATITIGNPTIIATASAHGLVTNDWVYFNEITGTDANLLNGKAFQVTVTGATTFTIAVDTGGKTINNNGIFQTLTKTSGSGDGIRWYDGDPTNKTGLPVTTSTGWANFAPPLTSTTVSIDGETAALYYLVGALAVVPFKDRLLFFSPWIQTSTGSAIQLQDTVIWSWNGTPYYNALRPTGETFDNTAWYVDTGGRGGFLAAGISQPIVTVNNNEDVLLIGFSSRQTRFVYTGNDFDPFRFFSINSELGSSATFSGITLDRGGITLGTYGIALTDQVSSRRIDLQIPDSVFEVSALSNGVQRVNAARDFFKEWIYFSYPVNSSQWKYPTQTFLYNYRDNTWAVLYENFTSHGTFRRTTSYTWATLPFSSWATWRESWNSGTTSAQFPNIVAGNPQGFVLIKGQGTGEGASGNISNVSNSTSPTGNTKITSTDHCVAVGDYLLILGCLGTTAINNQIGRVIQVVDANNFVLDLPHPAGTYLGLGTFTRLSQPLIQTKQFPVYWTEGRQVRLGVQKYLMDTTANGQVTLNIYLSQDPDDAWNQSSIVPTKNPTPDNSGLIYSQILFTCPEAGNLQMPTAASQFQIWHRVNTSLQGDTVQIGITLSDAQMRNLTYATSEIVLQGIQINVERGPLLA